MKTSHQNQTWISSDDVQGTDVFDIKGSHIGEIDHLIIEKMSGRVIYGVLSFGGFIGLGKSHYPIPWKKLTYDKSKGGFCTDISEEQLRDAPEFREDSWSDREWESSIHSYYDVPPYWL
ncbi:MAG: PRC-barrel domain-containing protein [Alphaproteobacteria bacterium]|nr:PRC-barrel domain-containing protein [Alphaproteobacteria bacterium]